MKNIVKILVLFFAFSSTTCATAQQKSVQKVTIKTSITCDHCKECETCGTLLESTLLKTKGIQMITLNEKESTITVVYNTKKTDLPTIKTAISQLGYDADDVKADPAGYEKLDGCCKA